MDAQETVQIEIDDKNEKKELKKEHIISNEIICSECKESCFIGIKDYNFTLFGCKNNIIYQLKIWKNTKNSKFKKNMPKM